ncbi:MAG: hypothetical protein ACHQPI_01055 [Thermoanaerobaculia bacterium]
MSVRPSLLAAVLGWRRSAPSPHEPGRLVGVAATEARSGRLARLAARAGLTYVGAGSVAEAGALAAADRAIVALDREFAGEGWRGAVKLLGADACVVLLAPRDEASLWEELASLGGFEVLSDASSDEEGVRLLRRARAWSRARLVTR